MKRPIYLGTNTKMFKSIKQTCSYLCELASLTSDLSNRDLELFVIPSFTALSAAYPIAKEAGIRLGAQNMAWEKEGQFTGEISPVMLTEVGVQIAEIGHSERRHILGETDDMENRKVLCALDNGLTPLLCIGETEYDKECGAADDALGLQIKRGLHGVTPQQVGSLWIAYEPVWAIGVNGKPASKEYASQRHQAIRRTLVECLGEQMAYKVPLLYGGSVNENNATQLITMPDIDGLFIGRAAWEAERFNYIIRSILQAIKTDCESA